MIDTVRQYRGMEWEGEKSFPAALEHLHDYLFVILDHNCSKCQRFLLKQTIGDKTGSVN